MTVAKHNDKSSNKRFQALISIFSYSSQDSRTTDNSISGRAHTLKSDSNLSDQLLTQAATISPQILLV